MLASQIRKEYLTPKEINLILCNFIIPKTRNGKPQKIWTATIQNIIQTLNIETTTKDLKVFDIPTETFKTIKKGFGYCYENKKGFSNIEKLNQELENITIQPKQQYKIKNTIGKNINAIYPENKKNIYDHRIKELIGKTNKTLPKKIKIGDITITQKNENYPIRKEYKPIGIITY